MIHMLVANKLCMYKYQYVIVEIFDVRFEENKTMAIKLLEYYKL